MPLRCDCMTECNCVFWSRPVLCATSWRSRSKWVFYVWSLIGLITLLTIWPAGLQTHAIRTRQDSRRPLKWDLCRKQHKKFDPPAAQEPDTFSKVAFWNLKPDSRKWKRWKRDNIRALWRYTDGIWVQRTFITHCSHLLALKHCGVSFSLIEIHSRISSRHLDKYYTRLVRAHTVRKQIGNRCMH